MEGAAGESPLRGSLREFVSSKCRSSECRPRELVAESGKVREWKAKERMHREWGTLCMAAESRT